MPFKSKAQRRKFAQLLVEGKITDQQYEEWNRSTGSQALPERVGKPARASAARTSTKRTPAARKSATGKRPARKAAARTPARRKAPARRARTKSAK